MIDAGMLEEGWNGNQSVYAPDVVSLKERARRLRCWLREREESEVCVVGHGMFWHHVTHEVDEEGKQTSMLPPFPFSRERAVPPVVVMKM